MIGAILDRTNIRERLDKVMLPGHPFPEISHGEVATAMIGLICLGKPDFDGYVPIFAYVGDDRLQPVEVDWKGVPAGG